jgi:hypothetical protein
MRLLPQHQPSTPPLHPRASAERMCQRCCLPAEPLRIKALGEGHVLVYQCDPELLPGLVALLEEQEVELVTAHAKACRQYRLEYEEAQVGRRQQLWLIHVPWLADVTTLGPQLHTTGASTAWAYALHLPVLRVRRYMSSAGVRAMPVASTPCAPLCAMPHACPVPALWLQVYAAEAAALQEKHNIALQAAADGGDAEEDVVLGKKVKKKKGAAAMRVDVEDDGMHDMTPSKRMRPASGMATVRVALEE